MNIQLYLTGGAFDAWRYFGAHPHPDGGFLFRVYAPHAASVALEGDFSFWHPVAPVRVHQGIYEFVYHDAREGQKYKYIITSRRGIRTERADPYAFGTECPPKNASVIRVPGTYAFHDGDYMARRRKRLDSRVSVYELHAAGWLGRTHSWAKLAAELIPYMQRFHYTHAELMPVAEHPMTGSWGYQVTGFFAPTARMGTPDDFAAFVDAMHAAGLGIIVDFVTVHFASDRFALKMFDGAALYESRKTSNRRSDWGSVYFEHTKGPVISFLQSAADYWLSVFHVDGLRFDAVSHLIYGAGRPENGENPGGIAFLRGINAGLAARHPSVWRIAEDSTLYGGTTVPVEHGGLGFDMKWDMGWTHDVLQFFSLPPEHRPGNARLLTLGLDHRSEAVWMLPFSHDDAAWQHLYGRMPGDDWQKRAQCRLFLLYMAVHPGAALTFMGTERGAAGAWRPSRGCGGTEGMAVRQMRFCEELNALAAQNDAFYAADRESWGAAWISCDDGGNGVYAMIRHSASRHALMVMNTAAEPRRHSFSLSHVTGCRPVFCSDCSRYGGNTEYFGHMITADRDRITVDLPALTGVVAEISF